MSNKKEGKPLEGSDYLFIAAGVVVLAVLAWLSFRGMLVWLLVHVRDLELAILSPIFKEAPVLRAEMAQIVDQTPADGMSFTQFRLIAEATGVYTRWLVVPLTALAAALILFKGNPMRDFRRRLSPESLAKTQAKLWPEIAPTVGLNLNKGDITKGKWAVAMTEWEFARTHKLVDQEGRLNRDLARSVFARQLGAVWRGPEALPTHAKAIYAALCLSIVGKRDEAIARLRSMAAEFGTDEKGSVSNMKLDWVGPAIASTADHPVVQRAIRRHAYNCTVMASLLQGSRGAGVLPSSMFIWLKPTDRQLWYVLNGVGRYAFFVECAGAMSHWLHEKSVDTKVLTPCVDKAVEGLEQALGEFESEDPIKHLLR